MGPILDDTLVYVIIGDNGASAEGTLQGAFNEMANFNGMADLETPEFLASKLEEFGGENSYGHYAVGWAWAMDTPYQWTKQVASHWGGTRNGTIVHWPKGIDDKGGVRNQFTHVIDLAPTVLEAAGIPAPTMVNGVMQSPYEGTSLLYSFNDADAPERHETQYFEMFCNRGIYHKGWSAVTKHRTPWEMGGAAMPAFDDDVWELYDGNTDWTQSKDLSKENPDKLHELQRLWLIEAVKYNVLPLDDRQIERINPTLAGRPSLIKGNSQLLFGGMGRLSENSVVDIKNKSFAVTSEVEVPDGGAEGVIIAQGGRFGGWSLYAKDGRAKFYYNVLGIKSFDDRGDRTRSGRHDPGAHGVRLRRRRDGQGRQRHALLRRQGSRQRPRRPNARASSSRRTRPPISATKPAPRSAPTTPRTPASSTARSTGFASTSATTPRTPTTTSSQTNASASRWRGSSPPNVTPRLIFGPGSRRGVTFARVSVRVGTLPPWWIRSSAARRSPRAL